MDRKYTVESFIVLRILFLFFFKEFGVDSLGRNIHSFHSMLVPIHMPKWPDVTGSGSMCLNSSTCRHQSMIGLMALGMMSSNPIE